MAFVPRRPRLASPRHTGADVRSRRTDTSVTVTPGTSLWEVAADHLGPAATDWEVAREWPRWHRENSLLIGEDPAGLRAGTVLRPPPPEDQIEDQNTPHEGVTCDDGTEEDHAVGDAGAR